MLERHGDTVVVGRSCFLSCAEGEVEDRGACELQESQVVVREFFSGDASGVEGPDARQILVGWCWGVGEDEELVFEVVAPGLVERPFPVAAKVGCL